MAQYTSFEYDPEIETPIWNHMYGMNFPVANEIAHAGLAYEDARTRLNNFKLTMNPNDFIHTAILRGLEDKLIFAIAKLQPWRVEWFLARYGIGLN